MPAHSRLKNGVASLAYVAGIHVFLFLPKKAWMAGTSPVMTGVVGARGLKLAAEGAMLQRGEQGVELGEVGAVLGFELVDLGDAGGEGALEIERRNRNIQICQLGRGKLRHRRTIADAPQVSLNGW